MSTDAKRRTWASAAMAGVKDGLDRAMFKPPMRWVWTVLLWSSVAVLIIAEIDPLGRGP